MTPQEPRPALRDLLIRAFSDALDVLPSQQGGRSDRNHDELGVWVDPEGHDLQQLEAARLRRAQALADALIRDAYRNGLAGDPKIENLEYRTPTTGATADIVAMTRTAIRTVIKIANNKKVLEEAEHLQHLHGRIDLPQEFRERFPRVYATTADGPPYGYLMECFHDHEPYSDMLFSNRPQTRSCCDALDCILGVLLEVYRNSIDKASQPDSKELYIGRIRERLEAAADFDPLFRQLATRRLVINGRRFRSLNYYLNRISKNVRVYTAPFATWVHGDSHPENILLRRTGDRVYDVKFIDPKPWLEGDYAFDLGKLAHFIECTGPAELARRIPKVEVDATGPAVSVCYSLKRTNAVKAVLERLARAMRAFAASPGIEDDGWQCRYDLSMASNLLGLPYGRLKKGQSESAVVLFGEGIQYLRRACVSTCA